MTVFDSLDLPLLAQPARTDETEAEILPHAASAAEPAPDLPQALAREAAFLVNGDSYFRHLADALSKARRSIWIVGWDFHPDILLEPGQSQRTLGDLLHTLAVANPELEIRILVWALGPVYSGKSIRLLRRQSFPLHPRIQLRFHMHADIRGSHHQKIVCIDDDQAYIGGIDLTARRWDTWRHRSRDKRRRDPRGERYDPLHDVQAMVTGDAAVLVGNVARHRWLQATGERLQPEAEAPLLGREPEAAKPPEALAHRLSGVPVAVAMTDAAARRLDGIGTTLDVIRRARRHLYIETQYLASFTIADALAEKLSEADGPEIVIICTRSSHGFIEKMLMANNRDRIIRRLGQVDHRNRLRVLFPVVPPEEDGSEDVEVLVHTKMLIADDRLLRIGSSNLNNRSEGLDTECDLLFRAEDSAHRSAIAGLRDALLGEHLGCSGPVVSAQMAETGSLIATIERLNTGRRGLKPFVVDPNGSITPVAGTALLDPKVGRTR